MLHALFDDADEGPKADDMARKFLDASTD
jgi:hypothetical protein